MKINELWVRIRRQAFPILIILAVAVAFMVEARLRTRSHKRTVLDLRKDDWVYYVSDNKYDTLSGRPGKFVSGAWNFPSKVAYKIDEDKELNEPDVVTVQPNTLHLCPPGQKGVDDPFKGVIRIWRGSEEEKSPESQGNHEARLGDTVTIEIKDFDRWVFEQFDYGRLKNDLNDIPPTVATVVKGAIEARRSVPLFRGVNKVNAILRAPSKDQKISQEDWDKLLLLIKHDPVLSKIMEAMPEKLQDETPTFENIGKLERQFLPIKVWATGVAERRFKELTLVLNGVTLTGLTPQNAYNEAEQVHNDRPSFRYDTYQWARFNLERMKVYPNGSEKENELAKANDSAWFKLIGKPPFWLSANVTLILPDEDLVLPTKITLSASNPDFHFYVIGIEITTFIATIALFLIIVAFLIWLAKTTDILRESAGHVRPDGIEPVSLSRTQMAFWFIVTAFAYGFIWATTGNYDTINDTCLILLGIGAGTALGATFIERTGVKFLVTTGLNTPREQIKAEILSAILARLKQIAPLLTSQQMPARKQFIAVLRLLKDEANEGAMGLGAAIDELMSSTKKEWGVEEETTAGAGRQKLGIALLGLSRMVKAASPGGAEADKAQPCGGDDPAVADLEILGTQSGEFQKMPQTAWKRLFADWLSEGPSNRYSFHRFQMLAWTMLLGFVFIRKVVSERVMPDFNAMTLSLLGISAGTYLGFKIPAVKSSVPAQET